MYDKIHYKKKIKKKQKRQTRINKKTFENTNWGLFLQASNWPTEVLAWGKKNFDGHLKRKVIIPITYSGSDATVEITTSFTNSEYFEQTGDDILLEELDYTSGGGLEGLDFNGGNKPVILIVDKIQILFEGEQN